MLIPEDHVDSSNRMASSNTSNRMVWKENLAQYHLTPPEEGKLVIA
jgi:hypothetical protein